MRTWILAAALWLSAASAGCALIEEPVKPGDPIIDPVTLESREATMADAIASIEAIDAKLIELSGSIVAGTQATNPLGPLGLAGTAGGGLMVGLVQRKRVQLQAEKKKLLEALAAAGASVPEGVTS
jgi:hypothetical protein